MMDLVQLRSFANVAERGTVAAAAEAQGYTAPAVSQQVAKLEAELDRRLFDRKAGRLFLSEAGKALLPIALQLLDLERDARRAAQAPRSTPHFVVAGFASALSTIVVPALRRLDEAVSLELIEAEDTDAMRELSLGTVDLVLSQEYDGLPAERDRRFSFRPLATDRLRLIVPKSWSSTTTVGELGTTPWLVNGRDTRCAQATRQILDDAGIDPPVSGWVDDNETLLALVAAGHGVAIVPALVVGEGRPGVTMTDELLEATRTIFAVSRTAAADEVVPLLQLLTCGRPT